MPGKDPAHVQQRGESSKVVSIFRKKRLADGGRRQRHKAKVKVASAR
jgi:hypothetical protein